MLHDGDTCTCPPIDVKEQYCDNTHVVEVDVKSSGEYEKHRSSRISQAPTQPPSVSSGAGIITVEAKIKRVFKGGKSAKGKKLILKSSNGMCGIGYELREGRHILAFSTYKDDVNGHEVSLYMCDLFRQLAHHRLPDKPRKFFKKVKC